MKSEVALPPPATLDIAARPLRPRSPRYQPRPPMLPLRRPAPFSSRWWKRREWPISSRPSGRAGKPPTNRTIPPVEFDEAGSLERPHPHRPMTRTIWSRSCCAPRDQFVVRPEQQDHRDHGEAIRLERTRQRRADGGGRRRSPVQRSKSRRDRPADQRRSPGRGLDSARAKPPTRFPRSRASGRFGCRSRKARL